MKYNNQKKCGTLLLTESLSLTIDVPIEGPINGNQKIRTDIKAKSGLNNYSVVHSKNKKFPKVPSSILTNVFGEQYSGTYIRTNMTKSKEGGESANPMFILSSSYLGG